MKKIIPYAVFFLITIGFYSPAIFSNKVPVPADLLLGSYYPWLDYNWGYPVSMPVKNPLISDIYSQFYPWKSIIAESYRSGQLPLWNQYSYSGYPLMANFHSGAFNPFNFLMVIFGDNNGWTMMLICQMFFSMVFMYFFLKNTNPDYFANITASTIYGLSPFSICWSQFMTAGFAMIWLPLILYFIKKEKFTLLPILYFLLMTSGHMQSLIFGILFSIIYYLYLNRLKPKSSKTVYFISSLVIGLGYMLIQILPTLEMSNLSIRFSENYINTYNYGLLPLSKLITLLSPDFFGNPTTGNYWGFFNYHETIIYITIIGFITLTYSLFNIKKQSRDIKFFIYSSVISLLLIFDNPISRLIYTLKIPFISTSAAGRIAIIFTLTSVVLVNNFLSKISKKIDNKSLRLSVFLTFFLIVTQLLIITILKNYFHHLEILNWYQNMNTGFRNTIIYLVISCIYIALIYLSAKSKIFIYLIGILMVGELFRFGWKYLPFVDKKFVFADTPVIQYLKNDREKYFRIMAEKGPILPANSWTLYRLSSPLGYDPMAIKKYFISFNQSVNNRPGDNSVSRYLEPEEYPAKILGEYNVKYLLTVKPGNKKINQNDWEKVFEDRSTVILKNKFYKPRVEIKNGVAEITKYSGSSVNIKFSTPESSPSALILRDFSYPGWQAYVDNKPININSDQIYRLVNVSGKGNVEYWFFPLSLKIGIIAFIISAFFNILLHKFTRKKQYA